MKSLGSEFQDPANEAMVQNFVSNSVNVNGVHSCIGLDLTWTNATYICLPLSRSAEFDVAFEYIFNFLWQLRLTLDWDSIRFGHTACISGLT